MDEVSDVEAPDAGADGEPPGEATPAASSPGQGLRPTIRLTLGSAEGNRAALIVVSVLAAMGGFAEAAVLVVIARLAFTLANHDEQIRLTLGPLGSAAISVSALVAVAALLVVVRMTLFLVQSRVSSAMAVRVARSIRLRLTHAYFDATWALQSAERRGRFQEMLSGYTSTATNAVGQISAGIVAGFSLISFMVTALAVSAAAAVAVAAAAVLLALILRPLRSGLRRRSLVAAEANLGFLTDATEFTSHSLEARVFGVEPAVSDRLTLRVNEAAAADLKVRLLAQFGPAIYQGTALLLIVAALGVVHAADITRLGALGGVVLIMVRSLTYGQALQNAYQNLHQSAPVLETIRDELIRLDAAAVDRRGAPLDRIGEVAFDHVRFAYEADVPVLHDVSFRVPHGEIVGIVGPSGAGKSTLVQLVLRLRQPTDGRVLADDRDVNGLALDDWYQRVGLVPQDPALFAGSIADNIRFFREGVDEAAIERAAKLANLHDEVMAWPLGYDTPVGERGGQLSGGQRQRLCIARALVGEPDVLVLDEPTSSLDVRSEALIRDAMAGLAPRTTVFVIAHRLSTLAICDRIMVLLNGKLEGFDTPERLEAGNRFYREALELSGLR